MGAHGISWFSLLKRNTTAVAEMRRNCWSAVQETVLNQLHRSLSVRSCPELDNLVDHLTQPGGKSTKHYNYRMSQETSHYGRPIFVHIYRHIVSH